MYYKINAFTSQYLGYLVVSEFTQYIMEMLICLKKRVGLSSVIAIYHTNLIN